MYVGDFQNENKEVVYHALCVVERVDDGLIRLLSVWYAYMRLGARFDIAQ